MSTFIKENKELLICIAILLSTFSLGYRIGYLKDQVETLQYKLEQCHGQSNNLSKEQ